MLVYIVVAVLAILDVVEAYYFANAIKTQSRQHGRRQDLLINQIMHLSNKTWQPPPIADIEIEPPALDRMPDEYYTNSDFLLEDEEDWTTEPQSS